MMGELLEARRCALLVIDLQERLMKAINKADRVTRNTILMIRAAKVFDIPVVATTQYVKGLGGFVPEIEELLVDVPVIDKVEFNAFANQGVKESFKNLSPAIDTVLITGVESHICVYQTAVGAKMVGLEPWIVVDAISSRDKGNHKAALHRFNQLGLAFGPAEMAIYELMGRAGTVQFKAMLPYIK